MLNKSEIEKIIPHREPFLLIDEIIELEPGVKATGRKKITENEYYLKGHFPGNPVVPGVILLESAAQVGAVVVLSIPEFKGKNPYFTGADKVRFKRMVKIGDEVTFKCEITRIRRNVGFGSITGTVEGETAVTGEIMFMIL